MDAGGVLLLDESGTRIETFVTDGDPQDTGVKYAMTHDLSTPAPLFDAVRTGELVWGVGEAAIAQRYPHLESLRRMNDGRTWGALPVTFEGRILGAIGLRSATSRELTDGEREFLLALGRQCGQALERARLHDATQAARAEAEQASRAKDDFLAMLGHELRNPLSPILTAVQLMRARDAATRFQPEIAILDIGLPDMDGYELAVAIRERLDTKVRLMALTGYGQQTDVARTERAGFDAHFVKPVALARLLTEIEMCRTAWSSVPE